VVGVISTRHLLVHPRTIVHEFGMRCYLRCIWRTATAHRPVTFLECACAACTKEVEDEGGAESSALRDG
jgi:hypothetical protein